MTVQVELLYDSNCKVKTLPIVFAYPFFNYDANQKKINNVTPFLLETKCDKQSVVSSASSLQG
jgi:hypothetical protein